MYGVYVCASFQSEQMKILSAKEDVEHAQKIDFASKKCNTRKMSPHHIFVKRQHFLKPLHLDSTCHFLSKIYETRYVVVGDWLGGVSSSRAYGHMLCSCAPLKRQRSQFRDNGPHLSRKRSPEHTFPCTDRYLSIWK